MGRERLSGLSFSCGRNVQDTEKMGPKYYADVTNVKEKY